MTNAVDFIRETAAYMVRDRPDLYNHATAVAELERSMNDLRNTDKLVSFVSFSSYVLCRVVDTEGRYDVEEFIFSKKKSGLLVCLPEADVRSFAYDASNVRLPHISSPELDPDLGLDNIDYGVVD